MDDPELLYVSDDPEFFPMHGVLFRGALSGNGRVVRLLFDHVNATAAPMRVLVGIANLDGADGRVDVLGASAGPGGGFMDVGHLATVHFLRASELGGVVSTKQVPARGTSILADFRSLPPGPPRSPGNKRGISCVAGIFDVQCLDDHHYELRVLACSPQSGMEVFDTIGDAPTDGVFRRGVFDISATVNAQAVIDFGGADVKIGSDDEADGEMYPRVQGLDRYRDASLAAKPPRRFHKGEFGVVKRFVCRIPARKTGVLVQSAHGGAATASYVIDGELLASSRLAPTDGDTAVIALVAPGEQDRTVEITTMADINSMAPFHLAVVEDATQVADGTLGPKISVA